LLLVVWVVLFQKRGFQPASKKLTWIEVEPIRKKREKENDSKPKTRVVQTTPGEKVDKALPDSYLGWQNQVVDKQTVSKQKTTVVGANQNNSNQSSLENKESNQNHKTSSEQSNKNNVTKTEGVKALSNLGVPLLPPPSQRMADRPEWATPGARPQDFVEGVAESDRTALNTKEYVFYGYFQRIRERLDKAWVPILRQRLISYYKTGRRLAESTSHVTKVLVILNEKGEITRVQMVSESGTRDLDDAAVNAFNKAGPFPNPPKGIIDRNREIKIPWDFVLKT
jgi:protein TonB